MENMQKTRLISSIFAILVVLLFAITATRNIYKADADEALPILQIIPSYYTVENVSEPFSLNLTITNATDLYGWEVKIYYLNALVECVNVTQGPFLSSVNNTFWLPIVNNTYNATFGRTHMACSLLGMIPGVNGSGTLATITFQAKRGGNTTLHLTDTKLADSNRPLHNPIPHTTINGFVNITEWHDIAITNVLTCKTAIGKGFSTDIIATIENKGSRADTFNVTAYANSTTFENHTIYDLPPNDQIDVTFTWDTADFAKGNYNITIYVWPCLSEANTTDNTFVYGWIFVSIPGDVDGDRDVDIYDVVKITSIYYAQIGDPEYKCNSDIDGDGIIDIYDVVRCTSHYGESW
jgi:hypothetical protein